MSNTRVVDRLLTAEATNNALGLFYAGIVKLDFRKVSQTLNWVMICTLWILIEIVVEKLLIPIYSNPS